MRTIRFHGTYKQAEAKAKKLGLTLYVPIFGPDDTYNIAPPKRLRK